jgi:hypothetical protein
MYRKYWTQIGASRPHSARLPLHHVVGEIAVDEDGGRIAREEFEKDEHDRQNRDDDEGQER